VILILPLCLLKANNRHKIRDPIMPFRMYLTVSLLSTLATAGEPTSPNLPGLPLVIKVSETISTGYEPQGALGFDSLKKLGIKTIISADGALPDLEQAKAHGMRYIHIPIGYGGIGRQSSNAITRAMREADGPVYVHCHHGRHRGPALAALALRAETGCDTETALKVLEKCGTGKEYKGLWKDVAEYTPPRPDEPVPELHAISPVDNMAQAMVKMDRAWDNIGKIQKAGWKTPKDHPDLSADHEILILGESFRTATRLHVDREREADFWLRMKQSEKFVFDLRDALKGGATDKVEKNFESIKSNCNSCHEMYRNEAKVAVEK